jgi:hypothetical protein
MGGRVLVEIDDAVAIHEVEDRSSVLIEVGGFGLREEGADVLRVHREQLISLEVELRLQLLDLSEVGLVVADVDLGHDLAVVVAELGVDLGEGRRTCGDCSLKNSVKTLYFPSTFFCMIWMFVFGFRNSPICSIRNSRSRTDALAFSFSSSG